MEILKILIIEDEPFAQEELKRMLFKLNPEFEILDMIDTVEDAVEWLESNDPPDLIFLDIQLADGISFEIFRRTEVTAPVIFTTAFDEYAIKAFRVNSIDYLLKPIKMNDLMMALNKFDSIRDQFQKTGREELNISKNQLQTLLNLSPKSFKSRFVTRVGDQIKYLTVDDVAYFYAEDNVVFVITRDKKRYIIDHTIEEIDKMVDPKSFFRLNRSFLSHIKAINKVYKYVNS
nr:response regulator transcription factor [Bacteroidota bacterium]